MVYTAKKLSALATNGTLIYATKMMGANTYNTSSIQQNY